MLFELQFMETPKHQDYPKESCGAHLLTNVPTVSPSQTVNQVKLELLEKITDFDTVNYIYVVDKGKLVGVLSIKELFQAPPEEKISQIMQGPIVVHPHTDQEKAPLQAIRHNIKAVPVVDGENKFLGVVGTDSILNILHSEHTEDFLLAAGIRRVQKIFDIVTGAYQNVVLLRLPWLIVGLVGGIFATILVRSFEKLVVQELAVVFFIPVIVYMSNAVGQQTQALFIRGVVLQHLKIKSYLQKELVVTIILSSVLSTVIFLFTIFWLSSAIFALAVGTAMFLAIIAAVAFSILIPLTLTLWKKDPALGSGPFSTIISDIISLLVYFSVVSLIV